MSTPFMQQSCADFAANVASRTSSPGGGSASAAVGAIAAALGQMAGNFTTGKKAFASVEDNLHRLCKQAEDLRVRLLDLVEEDAAVFIPLANAYGIPKDDPQRAEILEQATQEACKPPLAMMHAICESIEMLEEMQKICSRLLVSDVGCGAALALGALQSASMNVYVNTTTLTDRELAFRHEAEADKMLAVYVPRAQLIIGTVINTIRERK